MSQGAASCPCIDPYAGTTPTPCNVSGGGSGQLLDLHRDVHHAWDGSAVDASLGEVCVLVLF